MKTCIKCNETKDDEDFSWRTKDKVRSRWCKPCQKVYKDLHYENNKTRYKLRAKKYRQTNAKWMKDYKATKCCEECGEDHPATLDFHHKDSRLKFKVINEMKSYSLEKIQDEIRKCKILCSNCHRKFHFKGV